MTMTMKYHCMKNSKLILTVSLTGNLLHVHCFQRGSVEVLVFVSVLQAGPW